MKKILIVEDDVLISEHLNMILENLGYEVIGICSSMQSAFKTLEIKVPDLALLDIRMNGIDEGIIVAEYLKTKGIPFAFVTSFSDKQTLMDAVLQKPLAYVLKPFEEEDIIKALQNIELTIQNEYLEIIKSQSIIRIAHKDILFLKSENVYVEIHTTKKRFLVREKLSDLIDKLPSTIFYRTNQSYCVNINHVSETNNKQLVIENSEIPLSQKYRKAFFKAFNSEKII